MSTKYIVNNIFSVFLSLVDSRLANCIDLKNSFLLSVVQAMKKCSQEATSKSWETCSSRIKTLVSCSRYLSNRPHFP